MKNILIKAVLFGLLCTPFAALYAAPIVDDLADISDNYKPQSSLTVTGHSYPQWLTWGLIAVVCTATAYHKSPAVQEAIERIGKKLRKAFYKYKARRCPCVTSDNWCFCESKRGVCPCIYNHGVCSCIIKQA